VVQGVDPGGAGGEGGVGGTPRLGLTRPSTSCWYGVANAETIMDATLILIDSEAELARARALVERLWDSHARADVLRLEAQARLIAAYEERKWPRRRPSTADLIRHLMDQHGLA